MSRAQDETPRNRATPSEALDALPSALRSCPFCGGGLLVVCETTFEPESRPAYAVACRTKQCAGCVYSLGFGEFPSRAEAIAAWNRRAPDPVRAELLEASKEMEAFIRVMFGQGPNAEIAPGAGALTPLGIPVKIGRLMQAARARIAKAEGRVAGAEQGSRNREEPPSSPAPHEGGE